MSNNITTNYQFLNNITDYNKQNQFQLDVINQSIYNNNQLLNSVQQQNQVITARLGTYTRNENDITISQPLLGDQLYSIGLTSDPKQYVQAQDFNDLKKVVLGIDFVNNFQTQLNTVGGMDDQIKLLVQKTAKITQDDVNNLFILSDPIQSTNATQTTTNNSQYITYYQYNTQKVIQDAYNTANDANITGLKNGTLIQDTSILGTKLQGTSAANNGNSYLNNKGTFTTISSFSNDINAGTFKITNLSDPVNLQDAATKNWIQNVVFQSINTYLVNNSIQIQKLLFSGSGTKVLYDDGVFRTM